MTTVQPSIVSIITRSPAPWSAKVKLQRKLAQGWELDLFSTFLSRKAEQHCIIGPFRLCRRPAWVNNRILINNYVKVMKLLEEL